MRVHLAEDIQAVIKALADESATTQEEAVEFALRDWAIAQGLLPPADDLDEDTPTEGSA